MNCFRIRFTDQERHAAQAIACIIAPKGAPNTGNSPGHIHHDFYLLPLCSLVPGFFACSGRQNVIATVKAGYSTADAAQLLAKFDWTDQIGKASEQFAFFQTYLDHIHCDSGATITLDIFLPPDFLYYQGTAVIQQQTASAGKIQLCLPVMGGLYAISRYNQSRDC